MIFWRRSLHFASAIPFANSRIRRGRNRGADGRPPARVDQRSGKTGCVQQTHPDFGNLPEYFIPVHRKAVIWGGTLSSLFSTHPPLEERIAALKQMTVTPLR